MPITVRMRPLGFFLAVLAAAHAFAAPAHGDQTPEKIFRDARLYTVRIRTQITTPFLEDERGSFTGSGFLVDAGRRWVLTNAHVVGQCPSEVQTAFIDGAFRPARKVYVDSFTDVAVLEVAADGVRHPIAPVDWSGRPAVGEGVGAFGHPLDIPFTGTRGIVSGYTDQFANDLIQIDATVDHGNSGGPVIALRDGRVVGIATAGASGQKTDRLNFATPMPDVRRILELLRAGVAPDPPLLEFAMVVDEDGSHTLEVARTYDATRWPFEPGDRIVSVGPARTRVRTLTALVTELRGVRGTVALQVERHGNIVEVSSRPRFRPPVLARRGVVLDGALLASHSFEDSAALGEPPALVVHSVEPGSAAEAMGIEVFDFISSIGGQPPLDLDATCDLLRNRTKDGPIRVVLRRLHDGRSLFSTHARDLPGDEIRMIGPERELLGRR